MNKDNTKNSKQVKDVVKNDPNVLYLSEEQHKAMSQPVRFSIMNVLGVRPPSSIGDIAQELNRTPQSLYYHVEILINLGLIKETGTRPGRTRHEALYELVCDEHRLVGSSDEEFISYGRNAHRLSLQYLEDAHRERYLAKINKLHNANVIWSMTRLTPDKLEKLYTLIKEIFSLADEDEIKDEKGGDRYAILLSFAPLDKPKIADPPEKKDKK